MTAENVGKVLNDLDLSKDETERMTKAFKDPKFMEMFAEYAAEIADPAHRAETDAYLRQLERNGEVGAVYGDDVQLVMPKPGFVVRCREVRGARSEPQERSAPQSFVRRRSADRLLPSLLCCRCDTAAAVLPLRHCDTAAARGK